MANGFTLTRMCLRTVVAAIGPHVSPSNVGVVWPALQAFTTPPRGCHPDADTASDIIRAAARGGDDVTVVVVYDHLCRECGVVPTSPIIETVVSSVTALPVPRPVAAQLLDAVRVDLAARGAPHLPVVHNAAIAARVPAGVAACLEVAAVMRAAGVARTQRTTLLLLRAAAVDADIDFARRLWADEYPAGGSAAPAPAHVEALAQCLAAHCKKLAAAPSRLATTAAADSLLRPMSPAPAEAWVDPQVWTWAVRLFAVAAARGALTTAACNGVLEALAAAAAVGKAGARGLTPRTASVAAAAAVVLLCSMAARSAAFPAELVYAACRPNPPPVADLAALFAPPPPPSAPPPAPPPPPSAVQLPPVGSRRSSEGVSASAGASPAASLVGVAAWGESVAESLAGAASPPMGASFAAFASASSLGPQRRLKASPSFSESFAVAIPPDAPLVTRRGGVSTVPPAAAAPAATSADEESGRPRMASIAAAVRRLSRRFSSPVAALLPAVAAAAATSTSPPTSPPVSPPTSPPAGPTSRRIPSGAMSATSAAQSPAVSVVLSPTASAVLSPAASALAAGALPDVAPVKPRAPLPPPDADSSSAAAAAASAAGELEYVLAVADAVAELGQQGPPSLLAALVRVCEAVGDAEAAVRMYADVAVCPPPGNAAANDVGVVDALAQCVAQCGGAAAPQMLRSVLAATPPHLSRTRRMYTTALLTAVAAGDVAFGRALWEQAVADAQNVPGVAAEVLCADVLHAALQLAAAAPPDPAGATMVYERMCASVPQVWRMTRTHNLFAAALLAAAPERAAAVCADVIATGVLAATAGRAPVAPSAEPGADDDDDDAPPWVPPARGLPASPDDLARALATPPPRLPKPAAGLGGRLGLSTVSFPASAPSLAGRSARASTAPSAAAASVTGPVLGTAEVSATLLPPPPAAARGGGALAPSASPAAERLGLRAAPSEMSASAASVMPPVPMLELARSLDVLPQVPPPPALPPLAESVRAAVAAAAAAAEAVSEKASRAQRAASQAAWLKRAMLRPLVGRPALPLPDGDTWLLLLRALAVSDPEEFVRRFWTLIEGGPGAVRCRVQHCDTALLFFSSRAAAAQSAGGMSGDGTGADATQVLAVFAAMRARGMAPTVDTLNALLASHGAIPQFVERLSRDPAFAAIVPDARALGRIRLLQNLVPEVHAGVYEAYLTVLTTNAAQALDIPTLPQQSSTPQPKRQQGRRSAQRRRYS